MAIESRGSILQKALEKEVLWACAHTCVDGHVVSGGWLPTLKTRSLDSQSLIRTRGAVCGGVSHRAETPT